MTDVEKQLIFIEQEISAINTLIRVSPSEEEKEQLEKDRKELIMRYISIDGRSEEEVRPILLKEAKEFNNQPK